MPVIGKAEGAEYSTGPHLQLGMGVNGGVSFLRITCGKCVVG